MPAPTIRACDLADLPAITAIYAHYVTHATCSFELTPPTEAEMAARRQHVLDEGLPYFVAEVDGTIVGYAYASIYRARLAYRFTAEDSIYVHRDHTGAGIGAALLGALIAECARLGCRQMVAVISDPEASGSVRLHERFGFRAAGELKAVGYKFGRWIDTVRLQLMLGSGATTPPTERIPRHHV